MVLKNLTHGKKGLAIWLASILLVSLMGCEGEEKSPEILDYSVEYTNEAWSVPKIEWGITLPEALKAKGLSEKDIEAANEKGEVYLLKEKTTFLDMPENAEALVRLVFQDNLFVGQDVTIVTDDEEIYRKACSKLSEEINGKDTYPAPFAGTLAALEKGSAVTSSAVAWLADDDSSFKIEYGEKNKSNQQYYITIIVRPGRSL